MVSAQEAYELQRAMAGMRVLVQKRMVAALRVVAERYPNDPRRFRDASIGVMQNLTKEYGSQAGAFAAEWYNAMRSNEGIRDRFVARAYLGSDIDEEVAGTVRRLVGDLFTEAPDLEAVFAAIAERSAKYVADQGHNTIRRNSFRDPRARGWQRLAHGETCDFCLLLVGRGGVYVEQTVTFKSHVKCNCTAGPVWDESLPEVPTIAYEASARTSSMSPKARAESNQRIQEWIAGHSDELSELRASLSV